MEAKFEAKETLEEIGYTVEAIRRDEITLSTNYVKLGELLLKVQSKRYWIDWGYDTFSTYLETIQSRINKGRSQVRNYIGTVDQLLPFVPKEKLEEIGISKASELARFVRDTGKAPTENLINLAEKSDVSELRAAVYQETHGEPPARTTYFDLGGMYVTPEERKELIQTFEMACQIDPVVQFDWASPVCRKEVFTRMVQECRGTWEFTLAGEEGRA